MERIMRVKAEKSPLYLSTTSMSASRKLPSWPCTRKREHGVMPENPLSTMCHTVTT